MAKAKNIVKVLSIRAPDFCDEVPRYARVEITPDQIRRIETLAQVVKDEKAYKIEIFDYTADYFKDEECKEPWTDDDHHVDCCTLNVSSDNFWWEANIKHTDVEIQTDSIYIKEVVHG